jgi:hypothetical protein
MILQVLGIYLLYYEAVQLVRRKVDYFYDVWNYVEVLPIFFTSILTLRDLCPLVP